MTIIFVKPLFSLGFSQCIIRRQGQSDGQTRSVKSLTDADLITIVRLYSLFITLVSFVYMLVCGTVAGRARSQKSGTYQLPAISHINQCGAVEEYPRANQNIIQAKPDNDRHHSSGHSALHPP